MAAYVVLEKFEEAVDFLHESTEKNFEMNKSMMAQLIEADRTITAAQIWQVYARNAISLFAQYGDKPGMKKAKSVIFVGGDGRAEGEMCDGKITAAKIWQLYTENAISLA